MLVLERNPNERVILILPDDQRITVTFLGRVDGHNRLGFDAPKAIRIYREENNAGASREPAMSTQMTNATRERLLDRLLNLADEDLLSLCDAETQSKLRRDFMDDLDQDELESAVFGYVEYPVSGPSSYRLRLDVQGKWYAYLKRRDLLNTYRPEIERNYLAAEGGQP